MKELLLKENVSLQKHLVIVSVSNYKVIEEIKKDYFLCPECEIIHPKKSLEAVDETLFCPFNKLSFNSKKIELFNEQIVSYYLENTMLVIKEFIDDNVGKMVNKVGIQITRREELGNELRQKILSAISNVELDFIEND